MTNAEKYLSTSVEEFMKALSNDHIVYQCNKICVGRQAVDFIDVVEHFLTSPVKPIISEDERCILSNLGDTFITIARTSTGILRIKNKDGVYINLNQFKDNLFKFIEPGEEYEISDLLEN